MQEVHERLKDPARAQNFISRLPRPVRSTSRSTLGHSEIAAGGFHALRPHHHAIDQEAVLIFLTVRFADLLQRSCSLAFRFDRVFVFRVRAALLGARNRRRDWRLGGCWFLTVVVAGL